MFTQRPFRFGVINETVESTQGGTEAVQRWKQKVLRAEALGYSTFLIRDHFAPDFFGDQYAPFSTLAMAASLTTRLRIGTLVIDNDYRHPVILAKEAATLDLLSGGRFELGIGAGWLRSEYEQAGIPFDSNGVRVSRLEESIQVLKGLFADEPLTFTGQQYQIHNLNGFPKPAQRPHPPILIGAGQKRMLTLAGREADIVGMLTTSVASGTLSDDPSERLASSVQQKLDWVQQGASGREAEIELSLFPSLIFRSDRVEAAEELIRTRGWQGLTPEDVLAMPSVCIGDHEQIIAQLVERRARYGFSYFILSDSEMEVCAPIVERLTG